MVRLQTLDLRIGVQVPASQPFTSNRHLDFVLIQELTEICVVPLTNHLLQPR